MTAQSIKKLNKELVLRNPKGFTLIELLVVIGILAILLAITLIAINPARQFSQANDTKRRSDVNAILNAIGQYQAENAGSLPTGMPAAGATAIALSNTGADICPLIVPKYIAQLPSDPKTGSPTGSIPATTCATGITPSGAYDTGYTVSVSSTDKRVTVAATPELATSISVTR